MASVLTRIDEGTTKAQQTANPFLSGIHRPMEVEVTLTELEVRGTIPQALRGRYLRTGPNPVAADPASYHWFTGDGMVHGLAIRDGKAIWYRNRWIGSRSNAIARGTAPAPGPRHGPNDTVTPMSSNWTGASLQSWRVVATRSNCPRRWTSSTTPISVDRSPDRSPRILTATR